MTLQTLNVGAGTDDAHERNGGVSYNDNGTALNISSSGSANNYFTGCRFTGAAWSQGDTINSATFKLYTDDTDDIRTDVYCEDADAAATYASTDTPYDRDASKTTASTEWIVASPSTGYQSVTITTAVQEVTDRPGWGGSVIAVMVIGKASDTFSAHTAKSYESGISNSTPELDIDYTAGGGGGSIPVFAHHYKMLRTS